MANEKLRRQEAHKRSDGRWALDILLGYTEDGKRKRKTIYGKTKRETIEKADAFIDEYEIKHAVNRNDCKITVKELADLWLNEESKRLKGTSYDRKEMTVYNNIIPSIGKALAIDITDVEIKELLKQLRDYKTARGKPYSYSTIKKVYEALNGLFRYGVKEKFLTVNVVQMVDKPTQKEFEVTEKPLYNTADMMDDDCNVHYWTTSEIIRFKQACEMKWGNGKYWYDFHGLDYIFVLNTGIRIGEALALTWDCVMWDKRKIRIKSTIALVSNRIDGKKTIGKKMVRQTPKTKAGYRDIPLNKTAYDALVEIKKIRYFGVHSPIFCTRDGMIKHPDNFEHTFYRIVNLAGLEKCGVHTLRHTFASQYFSKLQAKKINGSIVTLSYLLGHADASVTQRVYIHLYKEQKETAVDGFEI